MHGKSFTAGNRTTIIGGRNVGDEYFGAAGSVVFAGYAKRRKALLEAGIMHYELKRLSPNAGMSKRAGGRFLSQLPIEWLL